MPKRIWTALVRYVSLGQRIFLLRWSLVSRSRNHIRCREAEMEMAAENYDRVIENVFIALAPFLASFRARHLENEDMRTNNGIPMRGFRLASSRSLRVFSFLSSDASVVRKSNKLSGVAT